MESSEEKAPQQGGLFTSRAYTDDGELIPKLQVLSFGAGQDSTALLEMWLAGELEKRYPAEHLLVVFSDTGDEHKATYEHLEKCKQRCEDKEDVEFTHITPDMGYHTESWQSLLGHYRENDTVGSKAFVKSCSQNLKISVIYKYLDDYIGERYGLPSGRKQGMYAFAERFGRIPVMIGIAEGEENRAKGNDTGPKWMQRTVRRIYPLIELGMDRSDCQEKIRDLGGEPPRPSMCRRCPFKTDLQVLLMSKKDPKGFKEWVEIERQKLEAWSDHCEEKGVENYGVWSDGRTLEEVVEDAEEKYDGLSRKEMEKRVFNHGHCVGTTY